MVASAQQAGKQPNTREVAHTGEIRQIARQQCQPKSQHDSTSLHAKRAKQTTKKERVSLTLPPQVVQTTSTDVAKTTWARENRMREGGDEENEFVWCLVEDRWAIVAKKTNRAWRETRKWYSAMSICLERLYFGPAICVESTSKEQHQRRKQKMHNRRRRRGGTLRPSGHGMGVIHNAVEATKCSIAMFHTKPAVITHCLSL